MSTTLTFASGLRTLVSRPALYGWNWSLMLNPSNDAPFSVLPKLNHDPGCGTVERRRLQHFDD